MSTQEYLDAGSHGHIVTQGLVTLLFGVVALFFPGLTLVNLLLLFAVYLVVVGVVELVHGLRDMGKSSTYWFPLLVGVVMLGAGVYLVRNPDLVLSTFLAFAGALVLLKGVADLFVSAFLSGDGEHRTLWVISGVVGVVAGLLLWRYPVAGVVDFVWVLGLYALVVGSVTLALGSKLKK